MFKCIEKIDIRLSCIYFTFKNHTKDKAKLQILLRKTHEF